MIIYVFPILTANLRGRNDCIKRIVVEILNPVRDGIHIWEGKKSAGFTKIDENWMPEPKPGRFVHGMIIRSTRLTCL